MTLFQKARSISAAEVARRAGLLLKQKGSREWCCCPLHKEKTPSCCFYPDGSWFCFGCGAGGDAISLYQQLYRVTAKDAARHLANGTYQTVTAQRKQTSRQDDFLAGHDDDGFTWDQLCSLRHKAVSLMEKENGEKFWDLLKMVSVIDNKLDQIWEGDFWSS